MATKKPKKKRVPRVRDPLSKNSWIPKAVVRDSKLLAYRAGWRHMQKTTHPDMSFSGYIRLALDQLTEKALLQR